MESHDNQFSFVSRRDQPFRRHGLRDELRHQEKVKEAIKDNLKGIISEQSIISTDPRTKKKVKIPMRSLELPRFRYGDEGQGVGSGKGEEGDQIGNQPGDGKEAGEQPGEEYFEAGVELEDLQKMVFEDLGLPWMEPKDANEIESSEIRYNDILQNRTKVNIDLGRTAIQNMMRNARMFGKAKLTPPQPEDYVVRTWEEERHPQNNAVVIAMADISGSMGEFEKYVSRAFYWWAVSFLRSKFTKVDIVFITHDTEAKEVDEEQFFTRGSGGGTKCSSAYQKTLDIINERYHLDSYNVYPIHFSDGDNTTNDNQTCSDLINQMLDQGVNQYAYVQVGKGNRTQLMEHYESTIDNEHFEALRIQNKEDVLPALQKVFDPAKQKKEHES